MTNIYETSRNTKKTNTIKQKNSQNDQSQKKIDNDIHLYFNHIG